MKQTFTDTLRQHKKAVTLGAAAAVLVLAGGGYALSQNQGTSPQSEAKIVMKPKNSSRDNKAEEANALLDEAEKKVTILEKNPITENVKPAQTATDKVADTVKKAAFQKRIDAAKQTIATKEAQAKNLAEAERLVKALEDHQVVENVPPAQSATDKVADEGKKGQLQARINAVTHAIQVRAEVEAQAAAQAEREAQAQAAAQAAAEQAAREAEVQAAAQAQAAQASQESPSAVAAETPANAPAGNPADASYWIAAGYSSDAAAAIAAGFAHPNDPAIQQAAVDASAGAGRPMDYSWAAGQ